jgi:hypothetical protein
MFFGSGSPARFKSASSGMNPLIEINSGTAALIEIFVSSRTLEQHELRCIVGTVLWVVDNELEDVVRV